MGTIQRKLRRWPTIMERLPLESFEKNAYADYISNGAKLKIWLYQLSNT